MNRYEMGKILDSLGFSWQHYISQDGMLETTVFHKGHGDYHLVATIDETKTNAVTLTDHTPKASFETIDKFYKSLIEYISTPIEEREYPKMYYIRLKDGTKKEQSYLNRPYDRNTLFLDTKIETNTEQTKFPKDEVDAIMTGNLSKLFVVEEVE